VNARLLSLKAAELDRLATLVCKRIESRGKPLPVELLYRPFLESRESTNAMLRLLPVDWRKKWTKYFERFGCLCCGRGNAEYASCGLCVACHSRISLRLRRILRELAEPGHAEEDNARRTELRRLARTRRGKR
jgi:hypothetical protein